jgi:hypothetical protein
MAFDKDIDLGLNSLHQHPSRALTKNAEQRIIFDNPAWPRQTNNITLVHGVSFQKVISSITKDTPPNLSSTKFSYSPSNNRILGLNDGQVRFRWRDYRDGSTIKVMQLEVDEFIRRFLLHVLPTGLMRIRHYGLFANRYRRDKLARCRALLQQPEPEILPKESTETMVKRLTGKDITKCTVCGKGRLNTVATLLPIYPTGPPRW